MRIYFDNAATTPLSDEVLEEMLPYMKSHHGNPSSIHADGRQARTAIERARRQIAQHIGASIGEIFFTSGGTEANNMALKCAVRDLGVKHIISAPTEHHCILHTLDALQRDAEVEVSYLTVNEQGNVSEKELHQLLANSSEKTLVSLMYANNEVGTLHNFEQMAKICQEHKVYFHSDTVQAIGHFPINVSETPVNFLAGSAHKFHGPKGVGFIYINNNNNIKPYLDGGAQERNMRGGTENTYGIIGMAKALDLAYKNLEQRKKHILNLRNYMKEQLSMNFKNVVFNGHSEHYLHKVLSVSFPPFPKGDMLLMLLDMAGISASGGSACSSGIEQESHVLAALQGDSDLKTIRFSFSHYNTKAEIDVVIQKLKDIIN